MCENGRLKCEERDGEECGALAPVTAREHEDERTEQNRDDYRGHARPEREAVEAFVVRVPEVPELVEEVFVVVWTRVNGRRLHVHQQERRGGDYFRERRVLADRAVVARRQVVVARGYHHPLVHGDALAAYDREHL